MGPLPRIWRVNETAGVIFDLDGVITDTAHLHFQAWQQIAAEIGISIDAQFNEFLKGISRDESLRRILQHGGKEGDFNPQERAQLAYRKNLLYVHSLRELTVNVVLPGIHNLLVDLRAQQIPVGLASVSLNAPTILAALELREFFTFCADASQLKNSKPDPEIFLAACAGLGVPPEHVSALKMRRRALKPLTPAVCARWGSARA